MNTTPHIPGKFVWFEHVSNDHARARAFYEPLFGWHVEAMPMGAQTYHMIMLGEQGIGGLRGAEAGVPNHWISYQSAKDVDAAHAAAVKAGAKSMLPPTDFPPVGRGAGLVDPTGAAFCLWKGSNGDPPDVEQTPAGGWIWNELWTTDAKAALGFYEKAFGYTHDTMDMGPQGSYYILKTADGKGRGGLMQSTMPGVPSMWLPYVHVTDCDAAAAKAQALGAKKLVVPPSDIPNVGRFAVLLDPVGTALGLFKPTPAP
jgi:predicted enzyme related to lactoylglutathione lyase